MQSEDRGDVGRPLTADGGDLEPRGPWLITSSVDVIARHADAKNTHWRWGDSNHRSTLPTPNRPDVLQIVRGSSYQGGSKKSKAGSQHRKVASQPMNVHFSTL